MKKTKPEAMMKAHQYLYYVRNTPIWSDYDYDMYCRSHGLFGGGGSDKAESYDYTIRMLAHEMALHPFKFQAKYDLKKAMAYRPKEQ